MTEMQVLEIPLYETWDACDRRKRYIAVEEPGCDQAV